MMEASKLVGILQRKGVRFFTGVPDSYLKALSSCLAGLAPPGRHFVAANEGAAVGAAIGHYMATGRPAAVYMQNSGLGNALNPLASLADREIYAAPMLLVIGWRGHPGLKDEPQHIKQGRITPGLLELLEIPFKEIDAHSDLEAALDQLWPRMIETGQPAALLVRAGTFEPGSPAAAAGEPGLPREAAIERILEFCAQEDCLVATTGKTGRELFELRVKRGEKPRDFLTVGGMGHAASIALGAALARPEKRLICLDGDGALLMHLGSLAMIGGLRPANFLHILLNNYCHESVGGQATCAPGADFTALAGACGYSSRRTAANEDEIARAMEAVREAPGPHFLEIRLKPGSRPDLGRPTASPAQNRELFREHLSS